MRVKREELLSQIEFVLPGLSPREIIEQSSCIVFKDGRMVTYNDEIACSHKSCVNIHGAVKADLLLALLRKLQEEELVLDVTEKELVISGKRRKAGLTMEQEILLPIDSVEKPGKWKPLPSDFLDAVDIVQQCAGNDESQFSLTCIHIHPKWIEACDNYQLTRYTIATGVTEPTLIRQSSLKHIVSSGVTEFSESPAWFHFRNGQDLVFSCRRYNDEFPKLRKFLEVEGEPVSLPKGLTEAAERAQIFSEENPDNKQLLITLESGRLRVKGVGVSGWYRETKNIKYNGPAFRFMISPKLLGELSKRHNSCHISQDRLKVDGGKFVYVSCLGKAED